MRPEHPLHNPFFNRFHEPVHRRDADLETNTSDDPGTLAEYARDRFGGLFALVALAISFVVLLRAF